MRRATGDAGRPRRRAAIASGLGAAFVASATAIAGPPPQLRPKPATIINGEDVGECGYASVGGYGLDDFNVSCSLTLIAPDVVLTAAHCLEATGTPAEVRFGEDFANPGKVAPVEFCRSHPGHGGGWGDIGFCVLAQPVLDIAITPIASGCELQGLGPGATLDIVGFGVSSALYNPEFPPEFPFEVGGAGTKRTTDQIVEDLVMVDSQVWMLGSEGNSACFGDSGGPAFVTLPDGQARVIGVGQETHPDNPDADHPCGYGVVYQAAWPHLAWLESASGRDLTPCWDGNTWAPGPGCSDFAVMPELELGTWAQGCVGGGLSGPPQLACSDPPQPGDGDGDPGDGDGDGDPGDGDGDGDPGDGDGDTGDGDGDGDGDTGDGDGDTGLADDGTDSGTSGDASAADWVPSRGCACALRPDSPGGGLTIAALILLGLARLRRRSSATHE